MRTDVKRATSLTALAVLIGWSGVGRAQQSSPPPDEQPSATILSLPDGADEGAYDRRMTLPDRLPVMPASLSHEDQPTTPPLPSTVAPPDVPTAAAAAPAGIATPGRPDETAPQTRTSAGAGWPSTPTSAPAQVGSTAEAPPAIDTGLAAAGLANVLATFVADPPTGDNSAQSAERRSQREAIAAFYASHANAPVWIAGGKLTEAARAVMARLELAHEDGLDLSRFPVATPVGEDSTTLARTELAISEAAVAYARQASGSRVNVARIGLIDLRPDIVDVPRVLDSVPGAADAGSALRAFNPPQPGYVALRDKLAELRQPATSLQTRVAYGPVLKIGMNDPRVPNLRSRLGLNEDALAADPLVYDATLATAVAAFQRIHHMPASGVLTTRTVAALSPTAPIAAESDIIANMELWRWMPRDIASDRIEVNIPDYTARVFRDGARMHETRVVVGQPDKPTPVFIEQMRFIIVNPYWNVPLSIIKNEMMPKLASDPSYFADHGYEVVEHNGTTYVRQPPGDGNALGRIKFMFPNSHSVYLHDTNARSYFARDMRALSHGCVRVEEPFSFAEAVMGRQNGWSEARIRKLIGGQERTINLPQPLPIMISYFTAFVDQDAGLQIRDDVYGYTGKVKLALGLADAVRSSDAHPAKRAAAGTSILR